MNKKLPISATILSCTLLLGVTTAILAADAPTAPEASPEVYKILAENKQWRVMEATWQPGQEDNFHSHTADRVSLFVTDCKLRLSKPNGKYKDVNPKAGKAKARTDKPVKAHKAKNIGDKVCIIRIVELK
ncbi:MAG: hypothetical protein OEW99_06230 [Gammaproteobacteria bacterium]|nr:hypothetical protein [Gammaproteobacteria bacterium]